MCEKGTSSLCGSSTPAVELKQQLGPYLSSLSARNICVCSLCLCWIVVVSCVVASIVIYQKDDELLEQGQLRIQAFKAIELFAPLALCILIALCTDCLGFIHTVSLRWSLLREGRLDFNTNLRLFSCSQNLLQNRWYTNASYLVCLVATYAATSQVFLPFSPWQPLPTVGRNYESEQYANAFSICVLGIGLFGQTSIATWSLLALRGKSVLWNSNPLDTVQACVHDGWASFRPNRCLIPCGNTQVSSPRALKPSTRQTCLNEARRHCGRILVGIWLLWVLTATWAFVSVIRGTLSPCSKALGVCFEITPSMESALLHQIRSFTPNPGYFVNGTTSTLLTFRIRGSCMLLVNVYALLVVALMQSPYTVALHCTELLVNTSRDEHLWRQAGTSNYGAVRGNNAIRAAFTNWRSIMLSLLKSTIHWLFGLSMPPLSRPRTPNSSEANMLSEIWLSFQYYDLFLLSFAVFVLSVFGSVLAIYCPKGPQPAAYGEIQTLADLIDYWGENQKPLFWGDKLGDCEGLHHAGTSTKKEDIGEIQMECFYK